MSKKRAIDPVQWPGPDGAIPRWWWMRFRMGPWAKWRVLLVEVIEHKGKPYVKPFQDCNCYPRTACQKWNAQFVPAEPPPKEWW